jgi:LacI family transcriptional regulator
VSVARERARRVTLRDVAAHAAVSVTTASFVLSGRHEMRISAATEERVLQSARMLDYRRRLAPVAAPPTGAPVIGLVSDVIASEAFGGEMVRGCISAAAERGHVVLMADTEGVDELEDSAVRALVARGVDRFVYATMGTIVYRVPEVLRGFAADGAWSSGRRAEPGLPANRLVLMNNVDPRTPVPSVIPDDHRAGRTAADALAAAGHTAGIWLVGRVTTDAYAAGKRLAGIRAALRARGLILAGHVKCGWWPDQTRSAVSALLSDGWWERDRPTAVIAMNDRAAMGVYQALGGAGLRVPDDVSVVSFDNSDLARWVYPGLSSLNLPYFDIGRRAVELLLDGAPAKTHKLAMELRERRSIGAPSRAVQAQRHDLEGAQP